MNKMCKFTNSCLRALPIHTKLGFRKPQLPFLTKMSDDFREGRTVRKLGGNVGREEVTKGVSPKICK